MSGIAVSSTLTASSFLRSLRSVLRFAPVFWELFNPPRLPPSPGLSPLPDFIPKNVWGVYAIILRKPGSVPLVYIGSGTSVYRGMRTRIQEHQSGVFTPEKLKAAYNKGYNKTRIVVLAHCAIPKASQVPLIRPVILALEAAFSTIFWAMCRKDKHYSLGPNCPWDKHALGWQGLCTHNPLYDLVSFDGILAPEQLAEIAAINREKQLAYVREYSRTLRKTKPEVVRARMKRANKLQAPKTKARQQEAIASGTYRCDVCDVNCRDAASLVVHNKTPRHARKVEEAAQAAEGKKPLYCADCKLQFKYPSTYKVHLKSKAHFRMSTGESLSRRQRTLDYRHHCKTCNLKFPWASALRYHLRSEDHRRLSSQRN
ncbi:hypothetical protein VTI28DRAFT_4327 [Corynascus sepedonium]